MNESADGPGTGRLHMIFLAFVLPVVLTIACGGSQNEPADSHARQERGEVRVTISGDPSSETYQLKDPVDHCESPEPILVDLRRFLASKETLSLRSDWELGASGEIRLWGVEFDVGRKIAEAAGVEWGGETEWETNHQVQIPPHTHWGSLISVHDRWVNGTVEVRKPGWFGLGFREKRDTAGFSYVTRRTVSAAGENLGCMAGEYELVLLEHPDYPSRDQMDEGLQPTHLPFGDAYIRFEFGSMTVEGNGRLQWNLATDHSRAGGVLGGQVEMRCHGFYDSTRDEPTGTIRPNAIEWLRDSGEESVKAVMAGLCGLPPSGGVEEYAFQEVLGAEGRLLRLTSGSGHRLDFKLLRRH